MRNEYVGDGRVRLPSGRVRLMTDRECDEHAAEMEAFADAMFDALGGLADESYPNEFHRFAHAMRIAERSQS